MLCGSSKIEILSSSTILVCCLARSLNARSLRQQKYTWLGGPVNFGIKLYPTSGKKLKVEKIETGGL
jgi:hypothetical protein